MLASECALAVALKALREFAIKHPLIDSAESHLTLALSYAEAYQNTLNSIYWIRSRESTKRRVSQQLNSLAFDAYSNLYQAGSILNQFMDQEAENIHLPIKPWAKMILRLNLATEWMEEEHSREIDARQLTIFP